MLVLFTILGLVTGGLSALLCPTKVDYTMTVHLPHPTNCEKFLTCVGNSPVEQACPAGLQWNERLSLCDYPREARCTRGELTKDQQQSFNASTFAASVCLPSTRCPLSPTEQVVFLKHRDCSKFYACVSTQAVELSCPKGLYWNSQNCVCDYEVDVECGEEGSRLEDEADVEPEPSEEQVDQEAQPEQPEQEEQVEQEEQAEQEKQEQQPEQPEPEEQPKEEPQSEPKEQEEPKVEAEEVQKEEPKAELETNQVSILLSEPTRERQRRDVEAGSTSVEPASSTSTSAPAVTSAPSGPTTTRPSIESGATMHAVSCFAVIITTVTMSVL